MALGLRGDVVHASRDVGRAVRIAKPDAERACKFRAGRASGPYAAIKQLVNKA
jgi:hypothetical protein